MITDAETALKVLADRGRKVPPPAPAGEHGGLAWLRTEVSRFAEDEEHARRRAVVERELARVKPERLRKAAGKRIGHARTIVATVLLEALGAEPADVASVLVLGPHYLAGEPTPELDEACRRLLACWSHADEEVAVARAAIVLQACDATGALIDAARECGSVETALRERPPVPKLRREGVEIDVAAIQAQGGPILTFGAGRRPCPGREHALAIAEGAS